MFDGKTYPIVSPVSLELTQIQIPILHGAGIFSSTYTPPKWRQMKATMNLSENGDTPKWHCEWEKHHKTIINIFGKYMIVYVSIKYSIF